MHEKITGSSDIYTSCAMLDAMIEDVLRIQRETGRPAEEYKIHPDDYDALRRQLPRDMYVANAPTQPPVIYGLRIVLDYSADRLPRTLPTEQIEIKEAYKKWTKRKVTEHGVTVECVKGLWRVTAPTEEEAERESRHYFAQYFCEGEYEKYYK